MHLFKSKIWLTVGLLLTLTACGGGGGGADNIKAIEDDSLADFQVTTLDNLTALKVELLSTDPNVGHQVSLKTTIRANRNFEDVPVLYILVSKADLEADREVTTVLYFGEDYVIPQVTQGESEYNIIATIPLEARGEAEWYLTPVIDPQGDIEESDKDDNLLTADTVLLLTVSDESTDRPDVAVKDILFDDNMVLDVNADDDTVRYNAVSYVDPFSDLASSINTDNITDFDFSASLELALSGSEPLLVGVYADLIMVEERFDPATQKFIQTTANNTEYPLLTWDWSPIDFDTGEELEPFYNYYIEQLIYPGEMNFVDLEFLIPGRNHDNVEDIFAVDFNDDGTGTPFNIRKAIEARLLAIQGENNKLEFINSSNRISFYVRIKIDKVNYGALEEYESGYIEDDDIAGEVGEFQEDDSEVWLPLTVVMKDADPSVDSRGIVIPLPSVGQTGECRDLEYEKKVDKKWGGKLFSLSLAFNNKAKVTKNEGVLSELNALVPLNVFGFETNIVDFKSEAMLQPKANYSTSSESSIRQTLSVLGQTVFSAVNVAQANLPFAKGMKSYEQEKKFSLIGGVVLKGAATMGYGLEVDASISDRQLQLAVGPFVEISGLVDLGVDLGVFKGSIEGQVVLLKSSIHAEADAILGVKSDKDKIRGTLTANLVNKLSGPSGKIEAVGSVSSCAGIDSVVNTVATGVSCVASGVSSLISGIGSAFSSLFRPSGGASSSVNSSRCSSQKVFTCPQAEVVRETIESFNSGLGKTTPILSVKDSEFGICYDSF
jgi:hypothetical protein